MARSDFAWINVDELFTAANPSATRSFTVEGEPLGTGFLLIQLHDVESGGHRIAINGHDLPSFDIVPSAASGVWTTWMDRIPPGFLTQGTNRITIRRTGDDSFTVANVAVHWREPG